MYNKVIIFFLINFCMGCQGNSQDFILYQKDKIVPQVFVTDVAFHPAALDFCNLFNVATGIRPQIVASRPSDGNVVVIIGPSAKVTKTSPGSFSIAHEGNTISITGTTVLNTIFGVRHFFSGYIGIGQFDNKEVLVETLKVPVGLRYIQEFAFEYREPYFPDNQDEHFRLWNSTHTIDEIWGLWGHNIHKFIVVNDKMLAMVNGKINEDQYCFSSPEFEEALSVAIKKYTIENGSHRKFMIMPNDNYIVCQCKKCIAAGNTKSNASPAVFTLLNKLAVKFPDQQFFSTAYNTTLSPPQFKVAPNAGVMISSMPFPKGVIIEDSNKRDLVEKTLKEWKKITGTIYLWDYAINFDNYFDPYPTVSIAQRNFQFYKKHGITGIFINGNEESYAAFDDLKSYLYAKLLSDPNVNIESHIRLFFNSNYPNVSELLSDYYLKIEKLSLGSRNQLDIYGGLKQAKNKYLKEPDFEKFYEELIKKHEALRPDQSRDLLPLITALTFQKLEILRTNGIGKNGYADFQGKINAIPNPEVSILLGRLKKLYRQAKTEVYNESGALVKDYIEAWEKEILSKKYSNLFFGKDFKVLSALDQDYQDRHMLNDGAIGFNDYYNNWLLSTEEALKIEISAEDIKGATSVSLGFLHNPRHKIHIPKEVFVTIGNKTFKSKVSNEPDTGSYKVTATIPIEIEPADKFLTVFIVKQEDYKKMSTACDEIIFN